MSQQIIPSEDQGIALTDSLLISLRYWWVIVLVFVLIVSLAYIYAKRLPDIYEARTKILVVSPVSEQIIGDNNSANRRLPINPFLGRSLSMEILTSLGMANDVLDDIIHQLGLRINPDGPLWSVEQLRSRMEVSMASGAGSNNASPLLTMTIRGQDPETLQLIAETWAELFVSQGSELFAGEADRTYNFVVSQYEKSEEALRSLEEDKLAFQSLKSLQRMISQRNVLVNQYEEFLGKLHTDRSKLVETRARLAAVEEALLSEPEFVTLEKSISEEALLILIASSSNLEKVGDLPELVLKYQEINELHYDLKTQVIAARAQVSTLESDTQYLEVLTVELENQIEDLSIQISDTSLQSERFDREIAAISEILVQLRRNYQETQITREEQSGFMRIVENAVLPGVPVGPDRQRILMLSAVGGVILGVFATFGVHYALQEFRKTRRAFESPD